eukprot:403360908
MTSLRAENLSTEETIKKFQYLEKRRKQQFLVNEIQQQDYDIGEFVKFLNSQKEDDVLEIDNWALEELEEIVKEFKKQYQPVKKLPIINNQSLDEEDSLNISQNQRFDFIDPSQSQFDDYPQQLLGGIPSNRITVIESIDGEDSILLKAISSNFKLYEKTNQIVKGPLNQNQVNCDIFDIQILNTGLLKTINQKCILRIRTELVDSHEKQCLRFLKAILESEIFRADQDLSYFLITDTTRMTNYLTSKLILKPQEMGLFNIYTEDGMVKIQTDIMSAIFSSKFPEFLQSYNQLFDNMFTGMKKVREFGQVLAFLYSHLSAIILKLDLINKKVLGLHNRDYNLENVGRGLKSMASYFNTMSSSFHQHLKKDLSHTAMLGTQSYQEIWDFRQTFKDQFLNISDDLLQQKEKLFEKGDIEKWGIKDQTFLEQNREALLTNLKFATPYMLHEETEKLERKKLVFQFFTNQVFQEVSKEQDMQYKEICGAFLKLAQKMMGAEKELIGEWIQVVEKDSSKLKDKSPKISQNFQQELKTQLGVLSDSAQNEETKENTIESCPQEFYPNEGNDERDWIDEDYYDYINGKKQRESMRLRGMSILNDFDNIRDKQK